MKWPRLFGWPKGGKRAQAGGYRAYAGARTDRLAQDWYESLLAADRHIKAALRLLRARSRELVRDNPYAGSYVNLLKANIVGPDGIRLQSRIRDDSGRITDQVRELNRQLEERFADWGRRGVCTVDGRLSFADAMDLVVTSWAVDGECLIRHHDGYPNEFGYAIQFLDPDQLDEQYCQLNPDNGNEIRMGVEVDRFGRAVAYWLWDRHPQDVLGGMTPRERVRVPADQIEHVFLVERPGQTRGVPQTARIMFRLKMLDGYDEAEVVAARESAAKPIYFKTTDESADFGTDDTEEDEAASEEPLRMEVETGVAEQLPFGVEPWQADPKHPTSAYSPFTKTSLRAIAAGLGVSYNALAQDLENVNYSSLRGGSIQERDTYRKGQRWLIEVFCCPVYARWLRMAATAGAVQLPSFEFARWTRDRWQPRGWMWVDPAGDLQANDGAVKLGVKSRTMIAAENGYDFEEVLEQLREEQDLAKLYGVSIDGPRSAAAQAPPAAGPTPTGDKPDPDEENEDENEGENEGDAQGRARPLLKAMS